MPADVNAVQFDLREHDKLHRVFDDVRPHAVIHAAAMANIDFCQSHPQEAEAVNVGVTRQLVELCKLYDSKLVFCSTDTVFDGVKGMYAESDPPDPLNIYGETKARAERIVQQGLDNSVIARLALVMASSRSGRGIHFFGG